MHPLEQVGGHQILETGTGCLYEGPIPVVVLLFILDGANARCAKRREAEDQIGATTTSDYTMLIFPTDAGQNVTRNVRAQYRQPLFPVSVITT